MRSELSQTRKKRYEESELPQKQERAHAAWMLALIALGLFIGYRFRTQFNEADLSLSGISATFLQAPDDYRSFADLTRMDRSLVGHLPDLKELPGSDVFRDMDPANILGFSISRNASGKLQFCGLKFGKIPTRFGLRLSQMGWQYLPDNTQSQGAWRWRMGLAGA